MSHKRFVLYSITLVLGNLYWKSALALLGNLLCLVFIVFCCAGFGCTVLLSIVWPPFLFYEFVKIRAAREQKEWEQSQR